MAQKFGRQWIGIDVTYFAINLIKRRLKDVSGGDAWFAKAQREGKLEKQRELI